MHCPKCKSSLNKKNGLRRGKQSYKCQNCGCQYVAHPASRAYSSQIKQTCIEMYLNGMGIRGISRVKKISHVAILNWIQEAGKSLEDQPQDEEIPEITAIDELQTFVGKKKRQDPASPKGARERLPRQQILGLDCG
jgi:insertion element IS1 protein InsB